MLFKRSEIKFFSKQVKKRLSLFFLGIFSIIIAQVLSVYTPIVFGGIIDSLKEQNDVATLHQLLVYLVLIIFSFIISPIALYIMTKFIQYSIKDSTLEWMQSLFVKNFAKSENLKKGEVGKISDRGIASYEQLMQLFSLQLTPFFVETAMVLWVLSTVLNPILIILIFLVGVLQVIVGQVIIKKRQSLIMQVNDAEDEMSGSLVEMLSLGTMVFRERKIDWALNRLKSPVTCYANTSIDLSWSRNLLALLPLIGQAMGASIVIGGWALFFKDSMSVGDVIASIFLSHKITAAFGGMTDIFRTLDIFRQDSKAFNQLLELPTLNRGGMKVTKGLDLTISDGANEIKIPFKTKVAIVGPTGGGKSTLLSDMAGIHSSGRYIIKLGDHFIQGYSSDEITSHVKMSSQMNTIPSGKMADSVFFSSELTKTQALLLSELSLPKEIISGKKEFTENASNISGGEARRLMLARLLNEPLGLNLLDEPLAGINPELRKDILKTILKHLNEQTLIFVTHNTELLDQFDMVISVDEGKLKVL